MKLGLMLLTAGAALGYLTVVDRMSPAALYAVELDTRAGVPVWAILVAAGALLTVRALWGKRRKPAPVEERLRRKYDARARAEDQRSAAAARSAGASDWKTDVFNQARALPLEPGIRVQLGHGAAPLGLLLERTTQEKARRNIDAFARFLATIPAPPRVSLDFRGCPPPATPWGKMVEGVFRGHFGAGSFRVISQSERVDVMFNQPDSRWTDAPG